MHQKPLVIFDLETTGLSRVKDYIIQFAGIKVNRETNDVIDSLNLYIQPDGPYQISIQAYFKHKIKPDFLKDKPKFSEVAQQIVDFIGDCDLLTYNGNHFDIPFLNHKLLLSGYNVDFINTRNCYDSFIEEKRRNGNTLEETYHRYTKKTMEENGLSAHDAFSDVKATYEEASEDIKKDIDVKKGETIEEAIERLTEEMLSFAKNYEFEKAASIRDFINELKDINE